MKSAPGPPMTLGNAAAARVRLIVWCRDCSRQVEPEPAELASRYGAEIAVLRARPIAGNGDAALSERLRMRGFGHLSR
jgi:hypothetical protein